MKRLFGVFVITSLGAIAGCSPYSHSATEKAPRNMERDFSAEDKRISRLLSLGNEQFRNVPDDQTRALLCDIALDGLSVQMRDTDVLSAAQLAALERARSIYRQRALAGRTQEQFAADRSKMQQSQANDLNVARIVVGCIRNLT